MIALPKFRQFQCDIKAFVCPSSHRRQAYCSYFLMMKAPDFDSGAFAYYKACICAATSIFAYHQTQMDYHIGCHTDFAPFLSSLE